MRLEERLRELERQLRALAEQRSTVQAPFKVVDQQGRTLFSVTIGEGEYDFNAVTVEVHDRLRGEAKIRLAVTEWPVRFRDDGSEDSISTTAQARLGDRTIISEGEIRLFSDGRDETPRWSTGLGTSPRAAYVYAEDLRDSARVRMLVRDDHLSLSINTGSQSDGCDQDNPRIELGADRHRHELGLIFSRECDYPQVELGVDELGRGRLRVSDQTEQPQRSLLEPDPDEDLDEDPDEDPDTDQPCSHKKSAS